MKLWKTSTQVSQLKHLYPPVLKVHWNAEFPIYHYFHSSLISVIAIDMCVFPFSHKADTLDPEGSSGFHEFYMRIFLFKELIIFLLKYNDWLVGENVSRSIPCLFSIGTKYFVKRNNLLMTVFLKFLMKLQFKKYPNRNKRKYFKCASAVLGVAQTCANILQKLQGPDRVRIWKYIYIYVCRPLKSYYTVYNF
jgi:hypothetical protein